MVLSIYCELQNWHFRPEACTLYDLYMFPSLLEEVPCKTRRKESAWPRCSIRSWHLHGTNGTVPRHSRGTCCRNSWSRLPPWSPCTAAMGPPMGSEVAIAAPLSIFTAQLALLATTAAAAGLNAGLYIFLPGALEAFSPIQAIAGILGLGLAGINGLWILAT